MSRQIKSFYKKQTAWQAQVSADYQQPILSKMFGRMDLARATRCLDAGSGLGYNLNILQRHCQRVVALDISAQSLAQSRQAHVGKNISFQVGDIENLPFTDNSFSLVVATEVLEHVPNLDRAVSELVRVLQPDGYLIVSTPNYNNLAGWYKKRQDRKSSHASWEPWGEHRGGFERHMTAGLLESVFVKQDLEILYRTGRDYRLAWFFWVNFIRNRYLNFLLRGGRALVNKIINPFSSWPGFRKVAMTYFLLLRKPPV